MGRGVGPVSSAHFDNSKHDGDLWEGLGMFVDWMVEFDQTQYTR